MKIVVNVAKKTDTTKFSPGDVLLYNGSEWYVTTKEELLKEAYNIMNETVHRTENALQKNALKDLELRSDFEAFKKSVNQQLQLMSNIIKEKIINDSEVK